MYRRLSLVLVLALLLASSPNSGYAQPTGSNSSQPAGQASADAPTAAAAGATYHLSIPAAAFHPSVGYLSFEIHGRYQYLYDNPYDVIGLFDAAVQLPQGATLTKMTFYFRDPGSGTATVILSRTQHYAALSQQMLTIDSIDMWGVNFGSASSSAFLTSATIDNFNYQYRITAVLPEGAFIWNCGVMLEYTLPATPPAQVITIPPAAFTPFYDGYDYTLTNAVIHNQGLGTTNTPGIYLAPVHLPDRSAITKLTFYWHRIDTNQVVDAYLQRSELGLDTYETMAILHSTAGSGNMVAADTETTIANNLVDNNLYSYWLVYVLPAAGYAGNYATGMDMQIEYTTLPVTRRIVSIPAAAFQPFEDGYDFENHARHLVHWHGPNNNLNNGWYMAPVYLPDGAMINNLRFYYFENSSAVAVAILQRTTLGTGNFEDLGYVFTSAGSNAHGSGVDNTIQGGPIDNSRYAYWIIWDQPANAAPGKYVEGQGMKIDYSYPAWLPFVRQ